MNTSIQKRRKIVKQAVANQKLEGLKVSDESLKIADNYITGEVSVKSVAEKIRSRYGIV